MSISINMTNRSNINRYSRVEIHGNRVGDLKASTPRGSSNLSTIPLNRSNFKFMIMDKTKNLNQNLWNPLYYRSETIFQRNPYRKLKFQTIYLGSIIVNHRHFLEVRFAGHYSRRLGCDGSPLCSKYKVVEDIAHALLTCTRYNTERSKLERQFYHLYRQPLSLPNIAEPWRHLQQQTKAFMVLVNILNSTGLFNFITGR